MRDDIDTFILLVPRLISEILAMRPSTHFGYGTFIDKPMRPAAADNRGSIYEYQLNMPLSDNYNFLVVAMQVPCSVYNHPTT